MKSALLKNSVEPWPERLTSCTYDISLPISYRSDLINTRIHADT